MSRKLTHKTPIFTDFWNAIITWNPALAGLFTGMYAYRGVYRSQWNTVTNAYKTGSLNGEVKLPVGKGDDYLTIGGQILYDKGWYCCHGSTHILPRSTTINHWVATGTVTFRLALWGGWAQRSIDRSKMTNQQPIWWNRVIILPFLMVKHLPNHLILTLMPVLVWVSIHSLVKVWIMYFCRPRLSSRTSTDAVSSLITVIPNLKCRPNGSALRAYMSMTDNSYFTIEADYSKQSVYSENDHGCIVHLEDRWRWKWVSTRTARRCLPQAPTSMPIPVAKLEFKPIAIAISYDANISQIEKLQVPAAADPDPHGCWFQQRTRDATEAPRF